MEERLYFVLFGTLPRIICHFGKSLHRWPHLNLNQQHSPSVTARVCSCCVHRNPICSASIFPYDCFTKSFGKALPKHLHIEIYITFFLKNNIIHESAQILMNLNVLILK